MVSTRSTRRELLRRLVVGAMVAPWAQLATRAEGAAQPLWIDGSLSLTG